ncbi:MAG: hypothetical protein JW882_09960 [Deltaproteobacteria bacterium]|nr:hypothetical protein [Deltaproteobacteria bacterium]
MQANPTKGQGERYIYCRIDGECVGQAAKAGWRSFNCERCEIYINRIDSHDEKWREIMPETKVCKKCGLEKPIDAFHVNNALKDGHENRCKDCKNATAREIRMKKTGKKTKPTTASVAVMSGVPAPVTTENVDRDNGDMYRAAAAAFIRTIERKVVESIVEELKDENINP